MSSRPSELSLPPAARHASAATDESDRASPPRSVKQVHGGLSLRLRLMLMLVAVFGVIQVCMSVVGLLYARRTTESLFNNRLIERAQVIASRMESTTQPYSLNQLTLLADESRAAIGERLAFTVYDANG